MAYRTIVSLSEVGVKRVMDMTYFCDIAFINKAVYDKAVSLGFNREVWENKNNNKVIVMEGRGTTIGERRIRVDSNEVSSTLTDIKVKTVEIIDLLQCVRATEVSKTYELSEEALHQMSGEKLRLIALAQTAYEEAAMWAEKACTA